MFLIFIQTGQFFPVVAEEKIMKSF